MAQTRLTYASPSRLPVLLMPCCLLTEKPGKCWKTIYGAHNHRCWRRGGRQQEVGSSFRDAPLWFFLSCLNALRAVSALNLAQPAFQESLLLLFVLDDGRSQRDWSSLLEYWGEPPEHLLASLKHLHFQGFCITPPSLTPIGRSEASH